MINMVHFPIKSKSPMLLGEDALADQQRTALDELLVWLISGFHVAGTSHIESSNATYYVMVLSNHKPARTSVKKPAPVSVGHRLT
jgi:hypothetical protein